MSPPQKIARLWKNGVSFLSFSWYVLSAEDVTEDIIL
jgi:hypothetical protein